MQRISLRTDQKTQLIDITDQVQAALDGANGAAAALVYVPHTTAGVTINEGADPLVARDLEAALQKIVDDGWPWQHVEDPDGPNAPSHVRGSLIGPQISSRWTRASSASASGRGSSSASSTGRATARSTSRRWPEKEPRGPGWCGVHAYPRSERLHRSSRHPRAGT